MLASPVTVPTLYFQGDRDGCIGLELVEGMEALFPNGLEKVIVPEPATSSTRKSLSW